MPCTLHLAWDDRLAGYDFGPGHPLAPVRVELTVALAEALGVLSAPGVSVTGAAAATDAELELVHDPRYIAAVREAGAGGPAQRARQFGLGPGDNPVFPGMHEASALVAGATLAAARAMWSGAARHGASIAGGLHHAMAASASGFCVYNDLAIAIAWLLDAGAERIAYVDIDVHHGDGVQAAFYDDPRVLTISLHETPARCSRAPGWPAETGGPAARGSAVNVALPAGTGDAGWLRAFHAVVPPLLRAFAPRCWSASMAATPTGSIRWPTCGCRSTASARRTPPSTRWPTRRRAAGGWPPGAAATAGPGRAADLDAPAGRGVRYAGGPGHGDSGGVAGAGDQADRPGGARADDRVAGRADDRSGARSRDGNGGTGRSRGSKRDWPERSRPPDPGRRAGNGRPVPFASGRDPRTRWTTPSPRRRRRSSRPTAWPCPADRRLHR